jgi:hypothetical protein
MSTQIFSTAQACADEVTRLRGQRIACRLQKLEGGGFTVVLMNGKAQPPSKPKAEKQHPPIEPKKAHRESKFNVNEIMKDIHTEIPSWLKENEGLHEEDQVKVQDFNIDYRPVKGSNSLWQLFVPVEKAAAMLTYLNTHACDEADPSFPSGQVDIYEKGSSINDLFVSLAVVITIEDGDIPDALHNKLVEKFRQPSQKEELITETPQPVKEKAYRESTFNLKKNMEEIYEDLPTWNQQGVTKGHPDYLEVLEFEPKIRHLKGWGEKYILMMPFSKAEEMLAYLNTHATMHAEAQFPYGIIDVFDDGPVSLGVRVDIDPDSLPEELLEKLVQKFS